MVINSEMNGRNLPAQGISPTGCQKTIRTQNDRRLAIMPELPSREGRGKVLSICVPLASPLAAASFILVGSKDRRGLATSLGCRRPRQRFPNAPGELRIPIRRLCNLGDT